MKHFIFSDEKYFTLEEFDVENMLVYGDDRFEIAFKNIEDFNDTFIPHGVVGFI